MVDAVSFGSAGVSKFPIYDVSEWKLGDIPTLGYMEKLWIKEPYNFERWLLKYASEKYPSDALNEKICCELAKYFGINHQAVELAVDDEGRFGCICKSFKISGSELIHGSSLIGDVYGLSSSLIEYEEVAPEIIISDSKLCYTLDIILDAISGLMYQPLFEGLAFDSVTGNVDKHDKNWGILKLSGEVWWAPGYDYGLSFYHARETESEWFQIIGVRQPNNTINFVTLFKEITQRHCIYIEDFMTKLQSDEFLWYVDKIFRQIPHEYVQYLNGQQEFLSTRRLKMLNVWEEYRNAG